MAKMTVSQIMRQVSATVNQEATAPTDGSAEWSLWLDYINRAYQEWAEANDWESLRKRYFPIVSGVSLASVALPDDFNKLATSVKVWGETEDGVDFPEVMPEQIGIYQSSDKYMTVVGNHTNGWNMVFHPGTLASGASVQVDYFSTPTSLASSTNIPITADPQYLIDRTIGFIFEARSDPRFQIEENKARDRLLMMIENANASKYNSYSNPSQIMSPERKAGFRLGRD
jgi:hypothetical protein